MSNPQVDARFDRAFVDTCKRIGCNPLHLLAVMMSESDVNPAAHNPNGDASGLIQFMPATLRALSWKNGPQAFRGLSASQQLPYVEGYYRPWANDAGAWDSPARLYQATFLPGTLRTATTSGAILAQRGGRLGWAYEANSVFDANHDKAITLGELNIAILNAIARNASRWTDLATRLGLAEEGATMLHDALASTVAGSGLIVSQREVQHALNALGMATPPLVEDGMIGPKSIAAVRAFQSSVGLMVDGRAGPVTRKALADAVTMLGEAKSEQPA